MTAQDERYQGPVESQYQGEKIGHGMTEEQFKTCIDWFDTSTDTHSQKVELTIGELKMLRYIIGEYIQTILNKDDIDVDDAHQKICYVDICGHICSKIRQAQLKIFNESLSADEIIHTLLYPNTLLTKGASK